MSENSPSKNSHYSNLIAFLFLLLALTVYFYQPIFTKNVRIQWDAIEIHYPPLVSLSRSFHEGIIPLWDTHLFCGYPSIGNLQAGIFYPVHFFCALLREITPVIVSYFIVFHYFIAVFGMYILSRVIGISVIGSTIASLGFGLSGQLLGHASHLDILEQISLLPWCLTFVSLGCRTSRKYFYFLAGVLAGFGALAGHFQSSMYTFTLVIIWLIFETFATLSSKFNVRILWRIGSAVCVVIVTTLIVSGVQLLPTAELALQSVRSSLSYQLATSESFEVRSLATLFFPNCYGWL